ncbi:ferritin-like domain-containing protein [Xylanimonas sp. McL0601]|uniref:YciE/YciF ferroxidase family protein n=1 Tax=Xylanimonas sp. McL0601 TaxID=3414739 RepID=UPI003CEDD644
MTRAMFEDLNTPDDLFTYRLGALLSAEHDSLNMLQDLQGQVLRDDVRQIFAHHEVETRGQIANVERCFDLLGKEIDDAPSPTTRGLAEEANALLRKADPTLCDQVALGEGLETEHYEIAAYTTLIDTADAMGMAEVCELLRANLREEQEAAGRLEAATHALTHVSAA